MLYSQYMDRERHGPVYFSQVCLASCFHALLVGELNVLKVFVSLFVRGLNRLAVLSCKP